MAAPGIQLSNGAVAHTDEPILASVEPSTPLEGDIPPEASQISLAVTDVPASPTEVSQSFSAELLNEDPSGPTVIPSSLTPPPSSQVRVSNTNGRRSIIPPARGSQFFSPPATILNTVRDRNESDDYKEPTAEWIKAAPAEELRSKLQICISENQKLKAEGAHHRLQLNLLNLQASNDLERAAVEHEMVRAEVDAIRSSEYFVQTKREMSAAAEAHQVRLQAVTEQCDAALEENKVLNRKFRSAKKVIMQKEEEIQALSGERDMLLNRIRENREHFQMLCSQGGLLHSAFTPNKLHASTTSQQQGRGTPRQPARRGEAGQEHGLSALLQAMSQDNNSAPTTPLVSQRAAPRQIHKHNRNVQSLSSLPTTPQNKARGSIQGGGLLPSISLVPQTEPQRYSHRHFLPTTPTTPKREEKRKSRESTISDEDNSELARQALQSASQPFFAVKRDMDRQSYTSVRGDREQPRDQTYDGSQASQEARAMLRHDARRSQEIGGSSSREESIGEKRKMDDVREEVNDQRRDVERDNPHKKMKVGAIIDGDKNVGLGIQYSR